MEQSDRKRASNYTYREKEMLVALVQKYMKIIENKKTNAVYNKQKTECWEKLAWEYNSCQTSGLRTGVQLKSCYEQLKKIAKQHKAEDKVDMLKTGGGTFTPKMNSMDEKVLSLLKENFFSIENKFDSNVNADPSCECGPSTNDSVINCSTPISTDMSVPGGCESVENIIFICQNEEKVQVNEQQNTDIQFGSLHDSNNNNNKQISTPCKSQYGPDKKMKKSKTSLAARGGSQRKAENKILELKKVEALDLKMNILKKIEETEIENLKGKILDNEIKEIIKEREILELQIKQIEYNKLV